MTLNRFLFVPALSILLVAACGSHYEVTLIEKPTAVRLPDGRVTVTAKVRCTEVGVRCEADGGLCLRARWTAAQPDGGPTDGVVDEVKVCHDYRLANGQADSFALTSTKLVATGLVVTVDVLTTEGGYGDETSRTISSP